MLSQIRSFLLKQDLYLPVRYSRVFRWYIALFKPWILAEEKREISFYKSFLPPSKLIFDIGAFDGHKTAAFLAIARRVVACEPDDHNLKVLNARFRYEPKRVVILNVAVDDEAGERTFYQHYPGSAFNTLNQKWKQLLEKSGAERFEEPFEFDKANKSVQTITLDQLIARYGLPDFIKIDVEGNENLVLNGLSVPVPCISFEANLPEFSTETIECIHRLNQLSEKALFNYSAAEELILSEFIPASEFIERFPAINEPSIEVICKM